MKSNTICACGRNIHRQNCRRKRSPLTTSKAYKTSLMALATFILLMGACSIFATTYYVDNQQGSDSYNGLAASPGGGSSGPWKTIGKVNNTTFAPGDRILFKRGSVWTGQSLVPKNGGAAGGTITISEKINGQTRSFDLVNPSNNNCIYFGAYGSGSKPRFQCNGVRGIEIRHNYLIFEDLHLADGANNVLWFHNTSGNYWSIVSNIDVTNCAGNAVRSSEGGGNLWFKGLYVYDYVFNGIYLEGSASNKLKGVLVENCHVEDPTVVDKEDAIACHNDGSGNRIDGDVIIRNNTLIRSGEDGVDVTSGTYILVDGNTIENSYEAAVHIDYPWVSHVEVRGNFMNSNAIKKGLGDLTIRSPNCKAVNNIIVGTGHHSVFLESTSNTQIWNNVIAPGNRSGNLIWLRADLSNIDIKNNIFDFRNTTQKISGTVSSDIDFDYNCYIGTSPSQDVFNGSTFDEVQSSTIEPNGFWGDPQFMNSSTSQPDHFKLQTTSPCMDNGTTVVIAEDYWGNARPQGSEIDVGVYESAALLPISLVEFKAEAQSPDAVTLTWITASEINNDYFNVERSNDGEAFNSIGSITSYGSNSQLELRYAFIDENPLNGRAYYRLKQTDFDGAFTYGPIRIIERNNSHESLAYPNPFVDRVT
ncbi:MAG: right-handed parallel beta-helix repeat-containing protein, partial [Saprospiraceae bacterium]|nr:right-handed parallel beta-helix repeat-containing protein [Saprospiraceae bacterium]